MAAKQRKGLGSMSTPSPRRGHADGPEELVEVAQTSTPASRPKAKITISIDADLADKLRAAADQVPRKAFPSVSALAERGIRWEPEGLRDAHNDGQTFAEE